MKEKLKNVLSGSLICLCEIVVGVLLLIDPVGFTGGIIIGFGWLLFVLGLVSAVAYFRMTAAEAARQQTLAKALVLVLLGLFCILRSEWFLATFPLLTLLYGVMVLLTGFLRVQWTVDAIRLKKGGWYWHAVGALVSLALSAVMLVNPFASTTVMWLFVAISLIAEGALDAVVLVLNGRHSK